MFCKIYFLRYQGEKKPAKEIQLTASAGWVWFSHKTPNGMPVPSARMYGPNGVEVARIEPVCDLRIRNGGVLIQGFERYSIGQSKPPRQSWWCVPEPPPGGLVWPPVPPFSVG